MTYRVFTSLYVYTFVCIRYECLMFKVVVLYERIYSIRNVINYISGYLTYTRDYIYTLQYI